MRILIADDHAGMRQNLVRMFEDVPEMQVVAEAVDGCVAVELARELTPDVVIMDVEMPRLDGIDATRQIVTECPGIRIVGLSTHRSNAYVKAMLAAGASAYVLKDDMLGDLIEAVEAVTDGHAYLSPSLASPHQTDNPFAPRLDSCCNGVDAVPAERSAGV